MVVKVRRRAPGAGLKAEDGAQAMRRKQVLIDASAESVLLQVGNGNLSLGIREAARRLQQLAATDPFQAS